jgi:hypothetical protein
MVRAYPGRALDVEGGNTAEREPYAGEKDLSEISRIIRNPLFLNQKCRETQ